MTTLRFEGCSDDTFGEYAHTQDDYDNCANGEPIDWLVTHPDEPGGIVVTGQYGRKLMDGENDVCWQIGVAAFDPDGDDIPMPAWPMRFERGERTYSPALVIEAPKGVQVVCLNRARGDR